MARRAPAPNADVLLASARRIDLSNRREVERLKTTHQDWQSEAWEYNDAIPEVKSGHRFIENTLSRLRLFPAFRPDDERDPVPLVVNEETEESIQESGLEKTVSAAAEAMRQLRGPAGDTGEITGPASYNIALVGECYLWERPDEELGRSVWEILSTDELRVAGTQIEVRRSPNDTAVKLNAQDHNVIRLWRRHPRWSELADAPMRALLDICEELLILTRKVRATVLSQLPAGIIKVPSELTFPPMFDADGQPIEDPFLKVFSQHMGEPISNPESPEAIQPLAVKGPAEVLKALEVLEWGRAVSEQDMKLRDEAIRRLASGIDLPVDVLMGMADLNHWNAWQVDEQTFKSYLEPLAQVLCRSLTIGFLRPALQMLNVPTEGVFVWYDPVALIDRPDDFDRALQMRDRLAVGNAYVRRIGGASEDDAPDEEEALALTPMPAGPGNVEQTMPAARALVAASGDALGRTLIEMDRTLRARVLQAADAAVRRMLDRAGANLARRAQGDKSLAASIRGMQTRLIPSHLGAVLVTETWGLSEDELIDEESADLEALYRALVAGTAMAALRAGERRARRQIGREERAEFERRSADHARLGWAFLAAAVASAARTFLFDPELISPSRGEFDPTLLVQPGTVRTSLDLAGGAGGTIGRGGTVVDLATGKAGGGVAAGTDVLDTYSTDLGLRQRGFVWSYGDAPRNTFEPHLDLDGTQFLSWSDEVLLNTEAWPDVTHFRPGDHPGCLCDAEPIFILDGEG